MPPIRILIADDDPDDIQLLVDALNENQIDCELSFVHNGIEFVDTITAGSAPDIAFLDINMPLQNGLEALAKLSTTGHTDAVPIYIVSTASNKLTISLAKKLGAYGYVVKPTSIQQYKTVIGNLMSKDWRVKAPAVFLQE